ncbi:GIGYF family protein CG11148-like isoform X2 [Varroa jacobsoni]|uniref:GIGYF family protein CG11148-like isoform X2 n=1 Tax=Varroa jacobsoni TaxID=62625 RepID=UPI000BF2568A|nr:GIGYF family protein CG11148-like isoform X2 [Varroa jacobsoni]
MADTTCSIKFGPEWLRVLSDAGGTGGGNSLQPQSAGGSGGSQSSGSLNSLNSISGHHGPPRKYPLARYRYGKEEMIAIYEQSLYGDYSPPPTMPPGNNKPNFEGVWVDRGQTPRSLTAMSDEEQRLWAFHRLPHSTTRGRGRGFGSVGGGAGSSSSTTGGWTLSGQGSSGHGQQSITRNWRSTSSTSQQYASDRGGPMRDRSGSGATQGSQSVYNSGGSSSGSNSSGPWRRNSQASQQQQQQQQQHPQPSQQQQLHHSPPQQYQQPVNNKDPHQISEGGSHSNNTGSGDSLNTSNGNNSNSHKSNSGNANSCSTSKNKNNSSNNDSDDSKVPEWADDTLAGSDSVDATDQVGSFDERGGFLGGPQSHVNSGSPLLNSVSSGSVRSIHHPSISPNASRQGPQQLQRSLSNVEGGYSSKVESFSRESTVPAVIRVPSDRGLDANTPVTSSSGSSHASPPQPQAIDDNSQPTLAASMVASSHCSDRDSSIFPDATAGTPTTAHWHSHCPQIMPQPQQQTPPRVDPVVQLSPSVIGNVGQSNGICDCNGQPSPAGCPVSCADTMLCSTTSVNPAANDMWYYKDPQGVIQGPFTSVDMVDWCRQGYFHDGLECRRACDSIFSPLGLMKKAWNGHIPFMASTFLPPITSPLFGPPIPTSVHNNQQHMHSVFGGTNTPMGGSVGGNTIGAFFSGVPNATHVLLSPHAHGGHMGAALSPRSVGLNTLDQQQIVTPNGIMTQQQQLPHSEAQLHHQGTSQLQQLFGSVRSSDVVSLNERHANMLTASVTTAASGLPSGMPPQLSTHSQSQTGCDRLLPVGNVGGVVSAGSHSSSLMSSPTRNVSSGKMVLSPVTDAIQRNIHDPHKSNNNCHEELITTPAGNALLGSGDDVCDPAAISGHVLHSAVGDNNNGISLNSSSLAKDLLLSSSGSVTTSAWYSSDSHSQVAPAQQRSSLLNAINENLQITRLQAASDVVRQHVQEKNERNMASDHSPLSVSRQSLPSGEQLQQSAATPLLNDTKKNVSGVSNLTVTTGGGAGSNATTAGNKRKKERRDKKATVPVAATAINDREKAGNTQTVSTSSNNKNTRNRTGGDDGTQRGTVASKESKKQQQQQQLKDQQDSPLLDWNDDYRGGDHEREPELIVPAPAPAVPAWGARAEWAADRCAPTPSLGEIQRAEEERAQHERAQRQREAARSGCTTVGARTWASAIAPTKSFEQIQKEEASRVIPNHVSAIKSPQSSRTTQSTLISTAVANGLVSSHQASKVAICFQQQQTPLKSNSASPVAPVPRTSPQTAIKSPPVSEVASNEQQLIDWCTQITMGTNSKTYLDIPTVVSILKDVESEAEIEDYVSQFFGNSLKEPRQFARQFVQKRARLGVGAASTQPRQPGWCTNSKKNRNSNGAHNTNNNNKTNIKKV